jgi:dihydroorotase
LKAYDPFKKLWHEVDIITPVKTRGLIACPTFFDIHTHVRLNGQEDYSSLQKAAIAGGFGRVLIQPNTLPSIETYQIFHEHLELARDKIVDFYWACSIFGELHPDGRKILCYSNDGFEYDTRRILNAFKNKKPYLLLDHSQLHELDGIFYDGTNLSNKTRPVSNEAISIFRNVMLGLEYGFKRFHIQHVSTQRSIETIIYLRKYAEITCEVTPHHLFFNMHDIKNTNFKVNPPFANDFDRETLIKAIENDVVDVLATDHAPHPEKPDDFERAPFGTSGIEIAFSAFYTIIGNIEKVIEKMTIAPGNLMGLRLNFDLDNIVLIDPDARYTVDSNKFFSKGRNCVFDGMKLNGKIVGVKMKGKWVYWDGEFFLN